MLLPVCDRPCNLCRPLPLVIQPPCLLVQEQVALQIREGLRWVWRPAGASARRTQLPVHREDFGDHA